jgi:hypothetical protein
MRAQLGDLKNIILAIAVLLLLLLIGSVVYKMITGNFSLATGWFT